MNEVFTKILKETSPAKKFLTWYVNKYNSIGMFQELSFEHQLGIYLEYFEITFDFIVVMNNDGKSGGIKKKEDNYLWQKIINKEDNIISFYKEAIIWLFKYSDLPF